MTIASLTPKSGVENIDHIHLSTALNQFLSVNIGVIRLLSVITTTPSSKNNVSLINTGPSVRH